MDLISRNTEMALSPRQPWPRRHWLVGMDLGQTHDPTAICVVERRTEPVDDWTSIKPVKTKTLYEVRHLERLPLGMSYPQQVDYARDIITRPPLGCYDHKRNLNTSLVVDRTGVGRAVFDLFRERGVRAVGISITAGEAEKQVSGGYNVAKVQLVSRLQAMLHSGHLKISTKLADTPALVRELADFRATFTSAGSAVFNARQGAHDDLVLAVAIAVWYGERTRRGGSRMVKVTGL